MATIEDMLEFGDRLWRVRSAAAERGWEIGRILGHGGYGVVFVCSGQDIGKVALKLPLLWPDAVNEHPDAVSTAHGPNQIYLVSATGPFAARGVRTEEDARALLDAACARQAERPCDVLPQVFGRADLAGVPAALIVIVDGTPLRRNASVTCRYV